MRKFVLIGIFCNLLGCAVFVKEKPYYSPVESHPTDGRLALLTDKVGNSYECNTEQGICRQVLANLKNIVSVAYSKDGNFLVTVSLNEKSSKHSPPAMAVRYVVRQPVAQMEQPTVPLSAEQQTPAPATAATIAPAPAIVFHPLAKN